MSTRPNPVSSNFDDQLDALLTRIKSEGWDKKFGIDAKTLDTDLKTQRTEKQKDHELQQNFQAFHTAFISGQSERYQRYMKALEMLRAAHRDQPDILKSLVGFKRKSTPRASKQAKSEVVKKPTDK